MTEQVDPRTVVKVSDRLWSEEVGIADAADIVRPNSIAYRFSNGREFVERTNPYEVPE